VILVTGASGQIGGVIIGRLRAQGYDIVGLTTSKVTSRSKAFGFQEVGRGYVTLDSLTLESVCCVVHCAASIPFDSVSVEQAASINREIDDNILAFASRVGASCVYISSSSVYGFVNELTSEASLTAPTNSYSQQKLISERAFLKSNVPTTVMRISSPYDMKMKYKNVLWHFISNAANNRDICCFGTGSRSQDFTHVRDIAEFVLLAVDQRHNDIFNVMSGRETSMLELAKLVVKELNSKSRVNINAGVDPDEEYRAKFLVSKAKTELGWSPRIDLPEGLRLIHSELGKV